VSRDSLAAFRLFLLDTLLVVLHTLLVLLLRRRFLVELMLDLARTLPPAL